MYLFQATKIKIKDKQSDRKNFIQTFADFIFIYVRQIYIFIKLLAKIYKQTKNKLFKKTIFTSFFTILQKDDQTVAIVALAIGLMLTLVAMIGWSNWWSNVAKCRSNGGQI